MLNIIKNNKKIVIITIISLIILTISLVYFIKDNKDNKDNKDKCDNVCPQDIVRCPGTNMWGSRDPCNNCKPKFSFFQVHDEVQILGI